MHRYLPSVHRWTRPTLPRSVQSPRPRVDDLLALYLPAPAGRHHFWGCHSPLRFVVSLHCFRLHLNHPAGTFTEAIYRINFKTKDRMSLIQSPWQDQAVIFQSIVIQSARGRWLLADQVGVGHKFLLIIKLWHLNQVDGLIDVRMDEIMVCAGVAAAVDVHVRGTFHQHFATVWWEDLELPRGHH